MTPYRSKAHFADLARVYDSSFFAVVGGVFMPFGGGDYRGYQMNSRSVPNWRSVDDGVWWIRDSTYSEPSSDYNQFCWLSQHNME